MTALIAAVRHSRRIWMISRIGISHDENIMGGERCFVAYDLPFVIRSYDSPHTVTVPAESFDHCQPRQPRRSRRSLPAVTFLLTDR